MSEKKAFKKKAAPKKKVLELPPNPTRYYGACVRKMDVSLEKAIALVNDFEFRVTSRDGDVCTVVADEIANRNYEASK